MRTVLHLTEQELRDLIVGALEARGFRTTGGVRVNFVTEPGGAVGALVENMREAEQERSSMASNAAADILGGDGGVMGRGDALGEAADERPAAPRLTGRRGRRRR